MTATLGSKEIIHCATTVIRKGPSAFIIPTVQISIKNYCQLLWKISKKLLMDMFEAEQVISDLKRGKTVINLI